MNDHLQIIRCLSSVQANMHLIIPTHKNINNDNDLKSILSIVMFPWFLSYSHLIVYSYCYRHRHRSDDDDDDDDPSR